MGPDGHGEAGGGHGRRAFLRVAGAGAVGAGLGALGLPTPAGAADSTFAVDLKRDHGLVGDGVTDDAPALQAALADLGRPPDSRGSTGVTGAYALLPPGDYLLRSTVRIHRFAGVLQGAGAGNGPVAVGDLATGQGTVLRWAGPPGQAMFEITDSTLLSFNDLRFAGNDAAPPRAALHFLKDTVEQNQGTNGHLSVNDCFFGVWPWTPSEDRGTISTGIELSGTVGDNDQFRISRCVFSGRRDAGTTGFRAEWPQSVWGSLHDCTFTSLDTGFETPASTMLFNPQFNRCGTDLDIRSSAQITIVGWQSESSSRLARLQPWASLSVTGGVCQMRAETLPPGSVLIDAHPSSTGQRIHLRDMRFFATPPDAYSDGGPPDIRFGAPPGHAGAGGFSVRVEDCVGLTPAQCTLVDPVPDGSRGIVEWQSRGGRIHQFRNELRGTGQDGTRRTLDTGVWDPPVPGSS